MKSYFRKTHVNGDFVYKYIYKITNKTNKKSYIGQTTDYNRRFSEHKRRYKRDTKNHLYRAFKKYGLDNFLFDVIDYGENYNELEKFYIEKYDSYNNGYNYTLGGEGTHGREDFLSDEIVGKIIKKLQSTDNLQEQIAQEFGVLRIVVSRINIGKYYKQENIKYPIREDPRVLSQELVNKIIDNLFNSLDTFTMIAEKMKTCRKTILRVNSGKIYKSDDIKYPIRKSKLTLEDVDNVVYLLKYSSDTMKTIGEEFGVNKNAISDINNGISYNKSDIAYPIRKKGGRDV